MAMIPLVKLCPMVANRETRRVYIGAPEEGIKPTTDVPSDWYVFEELYCDEIGCECRRVMINVIAASTLQHLATINHAFERPSRKEIVTEQTFLDPLNKQSGLATDLMDLFLYVIGQDESYRKRLIQHYRMFKDAINDPLRRNDQEPSGLSGGLDGTRPRPRVIPPPPRRGRGKWR